MSDPRGPEGGAGDDTDGPDPTRSEGPTGSTAHTGSAEDVGSVGEEAAKLFGALTEWARDSAGPEAGLGGGPGGGLGAGLGETLSDLAGHAAATVSELNAHVATGAAECSYCPLCRTVHVIRQTNPEVKAHLVGAASSFLQAMVGLLATVPPPSSGQAPGNGVEHIDLDDPDDEDDLS